MYLGNLEDFKRGWICGDFEPSLYKNPNVEVGIQTYKAKELHDLHYHEYTVEINTVLSGECKFMYKYGPKKTILLKEDDILVIDPKEIVQFQAITDCKILCVKYPKSMTGDKVVV